MYTTLRYQPGHVHPPEVSTWAIHHPRM